MPMPPDQQRVEMLIHLFHGPFKEESQITDEQITTVIPSFFLQWIATAYPMLNKHELAETVGVEMDVWEWFSQMAEGRIPVEVLIDIWPAITLARRPKPLYDIETASVILLLRYKDGTLFPMHIFAVAEALAQKDKVRDNDLAYFLRTRALVALDQFRTDGIDGMHAQGANYGDEETFNMFMGAMLTFVNTQIQPELREPLISYVRLMQGLLRPKISDHDRRMIEAQRSKSQGKVVGGFDLG